MREPDRIDRELEKLLDQNGIAHCYQCSRCTSACPSALVTRTFNPRLIILRLLSDDIEGVLEDETLWMCVNCHSCEEACPKGVRVAGIIDTLRNEAFKRGKVPKAFSTNASLLLKEGLVANTKAAARVRSKVGLGEMSTPDLKEILLLLKGCTVRERLGPEEEEGGDGG